METDSECLCCNEVERVVSKREGAGLQYKCITELPGFEHVCLLPDVLQTAYGHYRCVYGDEEESKSVEE
jgi:hypothetical protein